MGCFVNELMGGQCTWAFSRRFAGRLAIWV
jgi:hypothetical protein